MAIMPESMRLTDAQQAGLERIKDAAKVRHEKARRAAKKRGRVGFPDLPHECSAAFEEKYRKEVQAVAERYLDGIVERFIKAGKATVYSP